MRRAITAVGTAFSVCAAMIGAAGPTSAATSDASYSWHVADELLESAVGSPPWAIAEASNGDRILLDGTGALDAGAKTASGTGRFVHETAGGSVVGAGTFTAHELLSFQFYGCGGEGLPDSLCGGLAKLSVTLRPAGTSLEFPATLWIDCLLGDSIPSGGEPARAEGIRLNVKGLLNFNKTVEHSGFTVFAQD